MKRLGLVLPVLGIGGTLVWCSAVPASATPLIDLGPAITDATGQIMEMVQAASGPLLLVLAAFLGLAVVVKIFSSVGK